MGYMCSSGSRKFSSIYHYIVRERKKPTVPVHCHRINCLFGFPITIYLFFIHIIFAHSSEFVLCALAAGYEFVSTPYACLPVCRLCQSMLMLSLRQIHKERIFLRFMFLMWNKRLQPGELLSLPHAFVFTPLWEKPSLCDNQICVRIVFSSQKM